MDSALLLCMFLHSGSKEFPLLFGYNEATGIVCTNVPENVGPYQTVFEQEWFLDEADLAWTGYPGCLLRYSVLHCHLPHFYTL